MKIVAMQGLDAVLILINARAGCVLMLSNARAGCVLMLSNARAGCGVNAK